MGVSNQFVTINPDELKFQFELEKQVCCDLKVANTTDQHVAFKVKTTSPKKYFVRPNTGVIQPWDSCVIRVTLQAQKEYPPDMQCKDKFLLQSTKVSQQTDIDELPANTFNKEGGKVVEDCKLRVVYVFPYSGSTNGEDGIKDSSNMQGSGSSDDNQVLQRLRDERDAAVRQTQQLQRDVEVVFLEVRTRTCLLEVLELEARMMHLYEVLQLEPRITTGSIESQMQCQRVKRQRSRGNELTFSFKFALYVALFGIASGFLLNLWLSSAPTAVPHISASSSPPVPTPPADMSSSSPPKTPPPTDASSSPPAPTPPPDESLSSPPTPIPPTDATLSSPPADASLSSTPTAIPPTDESSTPPADSAPSTPPAE
uniref:MSP domain-containing protein n=1 Tax=Daucus carota subsp. sativus TaxID=79200 RepID=A0A166J9Q4_DAUCS